MYKYFSREGFHRVFYYQDKIMDYRKEFRSLLRSHAGYVYEVTVQVINFYH